MWSEINFVTLLCETNYTKSQWWAKEVTIYSHNEIWMHWTKIWNTKKNPWSINQAKKSNEFLDDQLRDSKFF